MGVDGISLWLVILTTFLMPFVIFSTYSAVEDNVKEFMICLLFLEAGMIGALVSLDVFLFYIFWEMMLIPMYLIIGVWGGEKRILAAVKFFIYTMVGSLLMLVSILYVYFKTGDAAAGRVQLPLHRHAGGAVERAPSRCCSLVRSSWHSRLRCRCSRSTHGCRSHTCRPRRPARSSWRACC